MASCSFAFRALLTKVNPDPVRAAVAQRLPGEVREWLKEHEFQTQSPHSRLIGSWGRQTATTDIKDVDTTLFLPVEALDRTPESVLRELKNILEGYPDATVEVSPQRRSIRLDFPVHGLCMDIVGAVAENGIEPLLVLTSADAVWDHVSVTVYNTKRCPTWEEMDEVKRPFFESHEVAVQIHPPKDRGVNYHPYCLHLWDMMTKCDKKPRGRPVEHKLPDPIGGLLPAPEETLFRTHLGGWVIGRDDGTARRSAGGGRLVLADSQTA